MMDFTFVKRFLHDFINADWPIGLSIEVENHFLWVPVYPICMELVSYINSHISRSTSGISVMVATWNRTIMKSWFSFLENDKKCLRGFTNRWILASAFKNINFTTCWPSAVNWILWHHPNGRPKSTTTRMFCTNFNSTIFLMKFWSDFTRSIVSMSIFFTQWSQFEISIFYTNIDISVSIILKYILRLMIDKSWVIISVM